MRLLVTGATGYLGREVVRLARAAGRHVYAERFEVRDADAAARAFAAARPDAVVHTAYRQDGPEARSINVDGARVVAAAATRAGARLVHLSTDVVFSGEREGAYAEDDAVAPVTEYGATKADAEHAVAAAHARALLVRTSLIYGGAELSKHERLALEAVDDHLEMTFFTDEIRSPVVAGDLASAILELLELDVAGPLHVAGADDVSRYEFARLVAAAHGRDPERLRSASSAELGIVRPRNCALDSSRAQRLLRTRLRGVREVLPVVVA